MRILLYNPDNGVTRNFMPHLWMFLLQALTPAGHEVILIDGNAQPMDEAGIARFVREEKIGLVGIGAMTRMIAKAYRMADAIRATGVPVVMGGPHVTEEADEALGRSGGPRHADAVDIKFLVDGRTVWVALPHPAWVEYKKRTRKSITDALAVEIAGHYLKSALDAGEGVGREMYSLTVEETLAHLDAAVTEMQAQPA